MTVALWCVLAASFVPFGFAFAAKWSARFDNANPRDYLEQTSGWRKRAHWAQLNGYETFAPFAAAVIITHMLIGVNGWTDILAFSFVLLRVLFGLCYVANLATLRSIVWIGSQTCVVGLFILAARGSSF